MGDLTGGEAIESLPQTCRLCREWMWNWWGGTGRSVSPECEQEFAALVIRCTSLSSAVLVPASVPAQWLLVAFLVGVAAANEGTLQLDVEIAARSVGPGRKR